MSLNFSHDTTAEEVATVFANEIKGKNVLVTGASPQGLGAETARVIAKFGAKLVVIAGRSQAKLEQTASDIKAETPEANIRSLIIDLNSLESVRKAAAEVNGYEESINILVNNAGIMWVPYEKTVDGFEPHFGCNHLAHFLFTALVFPRIVAASSPSSPSRVINVSSRGHRFTAIRFDDIGFDDGKAYDKVLAYSQSKTANILFSNEIARQAKEKDLNVLAYSLHPGVIRTPLLRHSVPEDFQRLGLQNEKGEWTGVKDKTVPAGAATTIAACFDPSIKEQTGGYLSDCKVSEESRYPHAASLESGKRLWELSESLVKEKFII